MSVPWSTTKGSRSGQMVSCPVCGTSFYVRPAETKRGKGKFCSRTCSKVGPLNPNWKGDAAHQNTKRERAQIRYPLGRCEYENCEADAIDRHHVDGDTGNNVPENIQRLCRHHHMLVDGRLAVFKENGRRAHERLRRGADGRIKPASGM